MFLNFKLLIPRFFVITSIAIFISSSAMASESDIARGKYVVEIGGCNDCHTAGYAPSGGAIPEAQWLLGDSMGYRGGLGYDLSC